MYLAHLNTQKGTSYQIRQSYNRGDNSFHHRIVFELGHDPRRYFAAIDDRCLLFNGDLVSAVSEAAGGDGDHILEELLVDFLPPELKRRRAYFRAGKTVRPSPLSHREREAMAREIHVFDKRRLYYLRYGAVDQSRLSRLHEKCCRPLLGQSRDEREYWFAAEERVLEPGMYFQYVYAIFDVQRHFHQSFAPWFPEALARDQVADHFLTELCGLHGDGHFWLGTPPEKTLHHHLRRYLFMFFDFHPATRSFAEEYAASFMAGHRRFRWPEKKMEKSREEASEIFATPYGQLVQMTGEELARLFRKQAMLLHPDRGGDHERFIALTEVYRQLRHRK